MSCKYRIISTLTELFLLFLLLANHAAGYQASNINIRSDRWPDCSSMKQFSEDAIRLMEAQSYEEKAIAIWLFIRMLTAYTDGNVPEEPCLDKNYVSDPLKILNVYGAHHCDGLTRIMETAWRSLGGRAEKLYRSGHTQADVFWKDPDGITRGHLFDISEGWFVYDRSGEHIASADDIALDYSLIYHPSRTPVPLNAHYSGMHNWIHTPHIPMPQYSKHFSLRENGSFKFYWGNLSRPYLDNFKARGKKDSEHGNYPVTYGNSVISYSCIWEGLVSPVYTVDSPYVISGVQVKGRLSGVGRQPLVKCLVSLDSGCSWQNMWDNAKDRQNSFVDIDLPLKDISPVGRYRYQVKWVIDPEDSTVAMTPNFHLETVVQHNIFSLPQLFPGVNTISVDGTLGKGSVLQLTWQWRSLSNKKKMHRTCVISLPHTYKIWVAGSRPEDITMEYLEAAIVKNQKDEQLQVEKGVIGETLRHVPAKPQHADMFDVFQIIGKKYPDALKSVDIYIDNIKKNKKLIHSLAGIMVLKDSAAWDIVRKTAFISIRHPVKEMAIQALFLIDPQRAVPILLQILKNNPEVLWKHDPANQFVMLQHKYNIAALIGKIFSEHKISQGVPHLIAVLRDIIAHNDKAWQYHASIIKSLGKLGDRKSAPAIRPFLERHPDTAAVAVWALGELGDKTSIDKIRQMFDFTSYELIKQNSAVALCRLKDTSRLNQILALLESPDENCRGSIAKALGDIRNSHVIHNLKQLIANEPFPWVRAIAQESIEQLESS